MKHEEWLDLIEEQYLEEAMSYEKGQRKKHFLRPALTAAAILVLLVGAVLVMIMTQQRSSSDNNMVTLQETETPVSVYYIGGNYQEGHYVTMNTNQAVTVDSTYIPQGSDRWEGIGFQLSLEGYRLDAATDNGCFLTDRNDEVGSRFFMTPYEGADSCYVLGYDRLSFIWRPYGTANFWGQEANIRLYAMKENVLYMYAVVHIAAPDQHCFTAEIIHYEDYTDKGGCAITEENRDTYYPNGATPVKTCDISEVRGGQTPHYLPLNILQPIAMKIQPYEQEKSLYYWNTHDFRSFLPFGIPFVAEAPERNILLRNSRAILYAPDAECTEEEMAQYLIDKGYYYLLDGVPVASPIRDIDMTNTAYGLLIPPMTDISDILGEFYKSHTAMTLEIGGYNEAHQYCIYALATVSIYCIREDINESIIVIERYEDYTDIGGISTDSYTYKNFGQAPIADRVQNILSITPQYTDHELETLLRWKPIPILRQDEYERYFNSATIESIREYYSRKPTGTVINCLLDRYPYAGDETIAKLAGYWIVYRTGQDYDPCPRLTAQILGTMTENTPRMSLEQALAIVENVRQKVSDSGGKMDIHAYSDLYTEMMDSFDNAAGAADSEYIEDPSINSDMGDRSSVTYLLSDGTLFRIGNRYNCFYISYYQPDDTNAVMPLEVSYHWEETHSDILSLEMKEPYTQSRKTSSSAE